MSSKGAPRRTHWTHVRPKEFDKKFFVVSISTASLLEVVFRHFWVEANLWFPSKPSSASNFRKSMGIPDVQSFLGLLYISVAY